MTYTLRPYQQVAVESALNAFKRGKPFVIQAATGAGKSLIISEICHRLNEPVLILQPSKEILEQNHAKLKSYGITDIAIYSASMNEKKIAKYTFATIGSIVRKAHLFKEFRYAIIDECHQVGIKNTGSMYNTFFREVGITNIAGLTATPFRLENKFVWSAGQQHYTGVIQMLNRITKKPFFKSIESKVEMADLINQGFLLQPEYHIQETDLSELMVNGAGTNYTPESVERWSDAKLTMLNNVAEQVDARHKRALVFCSSLRQCDRAVELLKAKGIHAEVLDGKTPKRQREDLIHRFQTGQLKWVINVGTMTTGFDCPPLDAIILMRPTMSVALYIQMGGRCVRLDPNDGSKVAHIYDFTGTVQKFGRMETIKMAKEDGYKDMLVSERGRIDNVALFSFEVKKKMGVPATGEIRKTITYADLAKLI